MPISITVPRLGWNMESGTFIEWLKKDGDVVKAGDRLFRLEGEKSVEEIESFDEGALFIPADAPRPGDTVAVGSLLGYLLKPGEAKPHREGVVSAEPTVPDRRVNEPAEASPSRNSDPAASPSVRRMAREKGIDLHAVAGSGPGGRITESDLSPRRISPRARRLAERHGIDWTAVRGSGSTGRIRERDIPAPKSPSARHASSTRQAIAARMMASRQNTAPVTLTSIVDATNLVNLREQFKSVSEEPVPSYTDFLLKLASAALQQHPHLTAHWVGNDITLPNRIDIGFAVDTDAGLLVPVVRDVPNLGLRQIAARSRELIDLARSGRLPSREMDGGCFTITNLGAFGIDAFTPIINYPECAVLGVGRIERRPVMEGDRVIGRDQVTLSLTFDHRIVDGAPAARFLQSLAQMVANPGPAVLS